VDIKPYMPSWRANAFVVFSRHPIYIVFYIDYWYDGILDCYYMNFTHNNKDYVSSVELKEDDYITISISTDDAVCGHITFRYYGDTLGISYVKCTCFKGKCLSKLLELMLLYAKRFHITKDTAIELFVEPDDGGDAAKLIAHYKKNGFVSDAEMPAFMTSTVKSITKSAKGKRPKRTKRRRTKLIKKS